MKKAATYEAIIAQLIRDGHTAEAEQVRVAAMLTGEADDETAAINLESLVADALEDSTFLQSQAARLNEVDGVKKRKVVDQAAAAGASELISLAGPARSMTASFQTSYIATHQDSVLSSAFSADGNLCATGSQDTSVKLIDISVLREFEGGGAKPSIRSYYENNHPVTSVEFHPRCPVLLTANHAGLILLFNYQDRKKHSFSQYQDSHPINDVAFHPMGDWAAVAASHPLLRLYDVHSERVFVSEQVDAASHQGAITCVQWRGNTLATGSDDGSIRFFDLRESQSAPCASISSAHRSYPVSSLDVSGASSGNNYVVSAGGDGEPALWDRRATGNRIRAFSPPSNVRCSVASFAGAQDQWVVCGGQDRYIHVFDSARDTKHASSVLKGHSSAVLSITSGPSLLCTGSKDCRARIWSLGHREREEDLNYRCYTKE